MLNYKKFLLSSCFFVLLFACGGGDENSSDESFTINENLIEQSCQLPDSLPYMVDGAENYELMEQREMTQRELDLWFHTSDCLIEKGIVQPELQFCIDVPQIAIVNGLNANNRFTCSGNDKAKGCHRRDVVMVEESIKDTDDVFIHEYCHRFCGVELDDRGHMNECFVFDEEVFLNNGRETWDCVCEFEILNPEEPENI